MKASRTTSAAILVLAVLGIALVRRQSPPHPSPVHEYTWTVMGTLAQLTVRTDDADLAARVHRLTVETMEDINRRMSVYRPESEISQLNSATSAVPISATTQQLLRQIQRYVRLTDGAFDPTVLPLVQLWGFNQGALPDAIPTGERIREASRLTGIDKLHLTEHTARFSQEGMTLDLGGIAKGYAVDRCYKAMMAEHPVDVIINLGGDLRAHGQATPERPWRIGVRHPFHAARILGVLELESGMAVTTSGNYERFVTIEGRRFSHIIDPRSGRPVEGMAGVTVLSPTTTESDALSTALYVTGLEQAATLLERFPESHALLVPDRQPIEIYVSPGFRHRFKPGRDFKNRVRPLPEP